MANGDITTITELGRYSFPGGGTVRNTSAPTNNKVMIWGRLLATYVTTGLDLEARGGLRAFGVSKADFWTFTVRRAGVAATKTVPTSKNLFLADLELITTPGKLFFHDQVGADTPVSPSNTDFVEIDWLVIGDDASVPVLT